MSDMSRMDMINYAPSFTGYSEPSEQDFSEASIKLYEALHAPLNLETDFTPESDPFSPTPLDPYKLTYAGLAFGRVSSLYLDGVMERDNFQGLPVDVQAALRHEMHYEAERRISKNKVNLNILTQVLMERLQSERDYGRLEGVADVYGDAIEPRAGLDDRLIEAIVAARAGKATFEEKVALLELVPEMGSIEIAKTTCPCDVGLAKKSQYALFDALSELQAMRPDWHVEFVHPDASAHRIVSDMHDEMSFDPRIIVSKYICARIDTGRIEFDVVTKQSNILLDDTTPGIDDHNLKQFKGQVYDAQPGSIMQYLRLTTQ